uniref:NADPH:quinone reductase n=1 Tax=Thermosporothrix sp. COM3 TaxID=2490863 RepID=A0A455SH48_9CHLR|nr:NADPH:quinone reductase [Thermosporothrix sp. COM3]
MKAIRFARKDIPGIRYEEAPEPSLPGKKEVLVRVYATSVMWQEPQWVETWKTAEGTERTHPIPGHDLSGVVVAVGDEVTGVKAGDAVYALTEFDRDGAAAEYTIAHESELAPKPRSLTHVQAAAIPLVGLTAWQALFQHGKLEAGQTILIHGAAGGVGSIAVQLAHWAGAHVIATASAKNHAFLRELGADEVIDYRTTRFEEQVQAVDLVLDTVGGATVDRSWSVLKKGGRLISVFAPISEEKANEHGVHSAFFVVRPSREELIQLGKLIDEGHIQPIIEQVFPLEEAPAAFAQASRGHTRGKLILQVREDESSITH